MAPVKDCPLHSGAYWAPPRPRRLIKLDLGRKSRVKILCAYDRGRVYGSCPTTTARFLRVAVTTRQLHGGGWGTREGVGMVLSRRVMPKLIDARDRQSVESPSSNSNILYFRIVPR